MNPQHQLATLPCFGTRPFCALSPSGLFTLTGDSRKHHPIPHTGPVHTGGNVTVYGSPGTALAAPSHGTSIQTP